MQLEGDVYGDVGTAQEPTGPATLGVVEMVDGVAVGLLRPQVLLALRLPCAKRGWLSMLQPVAGQTVQAALQILQGHAEMDNTHCTTRCCQWGASSQIWLSAMIRAAQPANVLTEWNCFVPPCSCAWHETGDLPCLCRSGSVNLSHRRPTKPLVYASLARRSGMASTAGLHLAAVNCTAPVSPDVHAAHVGSWSKLADQR